MLFQRHVGCRERQREQLVVGAIQPGNGLQRLGDGRVDQDASLAHTQRVGDAFVAAGAQYDARKAQERAVRVALEPRYGQRRQLGRDPS